MMPVAALPVQPLPLPVPPAALVTLDFTALVQGGIAASPPVVVENADMPAEVAVADLDVPDPEAEPLPAPPPLLAMLQPPFPPTLPIPPEAAAAAPVALPIQPDAPRPARAAPALPVMSAPAPTAEPAPPAAPTPQEAVSSTPPVDIAPTDATPAAPDSQPVAIAAPQLRAALPDVPQTPIDTADPRWIARVADEIARTASSDGRARFRLNPETLGSVEVTVRHTADGISVRFEVENESTRTLIAHAEQRLHAEARANGLRIADTQVDLADRGQQGRERPAEQPLIAIRATPSDTTPSADAPGASARYA
jgi:hypothetical protein